VVIFDAGGNEKACIGILLTHLEEDASKSIHEGLEDQSEIDFESTLAHRYWCLNQTAIGEAVAYLEKIPCSFTSEISDGNMQEGSFRYD
jgi:aspartyl-tRNA(Asn)/glutamyl-tRNA(Gln) amidotransferase subunit B